MKRLVQKLKQSECTVHHFKFDHKKNNVKNEGLVSLFVICRLERPDNDSGNCSSFNV